MQLIHHSRAHLHQTMPMPQHLPQITIGRVRHPDPRKAVVQQQPQRQLRILPIRLLLAHSFRADLGGIPNPQLKLQVPQQPLEPARMPTGLHPHPHLQTLLLQLAIELLRFFAVKQAPFTQLTRVGIY